MVNVPAARRYGFGLELNEDAMRAALNSAPVTRLVAEQGQQARTAVESQVRALASAEDAENYAAALAVADGYSDDYGFDFGGPYGLGNRPIAVVGIPFGRGPNPSAKPPLMVEAETHALTSVSGVMAGQPGEDIR
jgi:hypothetical protein